MVGAGLGGLTAAIALRRAGIDTVVFERRSDPQKIQVGVGMVVWHNGMRALQKVDLADRVQAVGSLIERVELRAWHGDLLNQWAVGEVALALGASTIGVTRADLHRVLLESLRDGVLRLAAECTGFVQDQTGVTVRLADGSEERGDLLIAADGVNSMIRRQLLGMTGRYPPYAGYTIWHAIIAFEHEMARAGVFRLLFGCGSRFSFYHVGRNYVYWSGIGYVSEGGTDTQNGRKAALLERFRGWQPPVERLIEATEESAIDRVDVFGGLAIDRWGEGRVTLLGDAAHPMTTNLGQGACMAIEDAIVLGESLCSGRDVASALRTYEARRLPRTTRMMKLAQQFNSKASVESWWRCWLRDQAIKLIFHRFAGRRYAEMLGTDP